MHLQEGLGIDGNLLFGVDFESLGIAPVPQRRLHLAKKREVIGGRESEDDKTLACKVGGHLLAAGRTSPVAGRRRMWRRASALSERSGSIRVTAEGMLIYSRG